MPTEHPAAAHAIDVYRSEAVGAIEAFYATIKSSPGLPSPAGKPLVGLLTFPNSGTSWFLQLSQAATGILNHTAYEEESIRTKGEPSCGVYLLNVPTGRRPEAGQPSFVKSHVAYYGQEPAALLLRRLDLLKADWLANLPPNCGRHIRLVRNPFDNLRARYHLHLEQVQDACAPPQTIFSTFLRHDLPRYLLWHTLCDCVADRAPLLTVRYDDLLAPDQAQETLSTALTFAGCRAWPDDVAHALSSFSAKYLEVDGIPVHLAHFGVDDIRWIASELRRWVRAIDSAPRRAVNSLRLFLNSTART